MSHYPDRLDGGSPYPLGASFDGLGVNFAVTKAGAIMAVLRLGKASANNGAAMATIRT